MHGQSPSEQQTRLERKIHYLEQDYEENMGQIQDLRDLLDQRRSPKERQAIREEIDELEQIAHLQRQALRKLRDD